MNLFAAIGIWLVSGHFFFAGRHADKIANTAELPPNPFYVMGLVGLLGGVAVLLEDRFKDVEKKPDEVEK